MTDKSTWWSVTAYNKEIESCEGTLPEFVREIHGGREICPSTGRLHFQGAIRCYEQIRLAKFKSWLPTAHIQPCRSTEALKKYVMKKETAVGEKTIRTNPIPHYTAHQICLLLAQTSRQTDTGFWPRAKEILRKSPELAGQLMNPSLRGFYEKTQDVWLEQAAIVLQQPTVTPRCDCGKDECEVCDEQEFGTHSINASVSSSVSGEEEDNGPPAPSPRPRQGQGSTEHED